MSSYIDVKYIKLLSPRLSLFKDKGNNLFNFRCPHCGDSKSSRTKARGYFYRKKNDFFFKCHNCGSGQNLSNFLKKIDYSLYEQYVLERYKGGAPATEKPEFKIQDFKPSFNLTPLTRLTKISELKDDHPVVKLLKKRKLENFFDRLYLTDKFYTYVNSVKPKTFRKIIKDHPRLIIPFFDEMGNVFAFQGRSFGNEKPKYITIKLNEDKDKIYGLDSIDWNKHIYVVEGPLDSLFVDNCLAGAGADIKLEVAPENVTYVFDNEPRNKEIVKRLEAYIVKGNQVVIWPSHIKEKDINDMIINGMTSENIMTLIKENTFSGLSAQTKLNSYKRC